ncbi:cytochrome P450 [Diaporthe sp. PMI_573]|nr:cytochrome P450 [Diaporthaceae sp. PMI_573]
MTPVLWLTKKTLSQLLVLWRVGIVIYRLFFHRLAKYLGPKLYATSNLFFQWKCNISGILMLKSKTLHEKYGPIVRVALDYLLVNSSLAWPQVFQHWPSKVEWLKQHGFYHPGDETSLIGGTHEHHKRLWCQLNHAFSTESMYEQEPITFDIIPWFNFLTFNIIGDLVFAESFGCVQKGGYHPWVAAIFETVVASGFYRVSQAFPSLCPLMKTFGSLAKSIKLEAEGRKFVVEKALVRKAQGESPRGCRDFMTYMLRKNHNGQPGFQDSNLITNTPLIISAGSKATATALMYLPAAQTPLRVSPGAELEWEHIPKGTVITVFQWATYHNANNFHDPDNFRPERWLPTNHELYDPVFANDNKQCFHPFSFGVRDCVGKNLALSELRVAISRLLYRFDLELAPGQEDWLDDGRVLVVWVKDPLRVKLTERKLIPGA